MSSQTLYRLSGIGLLVGYPLAFVGTIVYVFFGNPASFPQSGVALTWLIAYTFVLLGLPGFYLRQAQKAGILGLIGFVLLFCQSIISAGGATAGSMFIPMLFPTGQPVIPAEMPLPGVMFFMLLSLLLLGGVLILGIATLRTGVFARWIGWSFLGIAVLNAVSFLPSGLLPGSVIGMITLLADLIMDGTMAWIGLSLLRTKESTVAASSEVSAASA